MQVFLSYINNMYKPHGFKQLFIFGNTSSFVYSYIASSPGDRSSIPGFHTKDFKNGIWYLLA